MISRSDVNNLKVGQILYHSHLRNSDGTAVRCKVNGKPILLKTQPNFFKVPVKFGLRTCFYLAASNAPDWQLTEPSRVPPRKGVRSKDA